MKFASTHPCPGCNKLVQNKFLACGRCWHQLPKDLQRQVVRTATRPITDPERAEILVAVTTFYAERR